MTRQFGRYFGLFSLCVTAAWGGEETTDCPASPSPTIAVPHPLPTVPVSLPRPPLAESDLSPIEHIRRAADHLEAGAVGPIAEEMCDRADELRKMADELEKDAAARLAELRRQLSEIQAQIRQLEQLADLPKEVQVQVDLQVIELDVTKAKKVGLEVEVLIGGRCRPCRAAAESDKHGETVELVSAVDEVDACKPLDLAGTFEGPSPKCFFLPAKTAASFLDELEEHGFAKVVTRPRLITTSGQSASIHCGGEFPIPIPHGAGTVTIERRKFGVMAEVVPVVLDNGKLRLNIAQEISERDFSNSVEIEGMVVPGITTRRVNTQVVMEFGQTLVIGGMTSTSQRPVALEELPIANKIPYITRFFQAVHSATVSSEKMLVILATPKRIDAPRN